MTRGVRIEVPTPYYLGPVNAWLLLRDACILVDSGMGTPEARDAMLGGLRKAGGEPRDIQTILLTHGHPDHFGLARELRDAGGAKIHVHEDDRKLVEGYPDTHRRIHEGFADTAVAHGFSPERFEEAGGVVARAGDRPIRRRRTRS